MVDLLKIRYSTESKYRKCVKGYNFLSFAKKFGEKYGTKLIDTATKTGIAAAKSASKRVLQKTTEATEDFIGNKIFDKITSLGGKKNWRKRIWKTRNLYSTRKKTANCWWLEIVLASYKNGIPKNHKSVRYNI